MEEGKRHKVMIQNRESGTIGGVKRVISFDLQEIHLDTELGKMKILGEELYIGRLSLEKGEVDFTGHIDKIYYTEAKGKEKSSDSAWGKWFK